MTVQIIHEVNKSSLAWIDDGDDVQRIKAIDLVWLAMNYKVLRDKGILKDD